MCGKNNGEGSILLYAAKQSHMRIPIIFPFETFFNTPITKNIKGNVKGQIYLG
jgi:hypothetical protein